MSIQTKVAAMTGAEAPPRSNGELVFEEPWQARVFGVAVGLVREQELDWEEFPGRLIEEIAAWEREHPGAAGDAYGYYERWYSALERLVLERGLATRAEIDQEVQHVLAEDEHDHHH